MPDEKRKKGGGSKLSRSQTVTVRLDPKLRYLAELAARKQRRTLSSFIEWAIEESLRDVVLRVNDGEPPHTVAGQAKLLWDVDEPDRFVQLAFLYPEMLTHDEQVLWKLVQEQPYMWENLSGTDDKLNWTTDPGNLALDRLRRNWDKFKAVANKEADPSSIEFANLDKGPNHEA